MNSDLRRLDRDVAERVLGWVWVTINPGWALLDGLEPDKHPYTGTRWLARPDFADEECASPDGMLRPANMTEREDCDRHFPRPWSEDDALAMMVVRAVQKRGWEWMFASHRALGTDFDGDPIVWGWTASCLKGDDEVSAVAHTLPEAVCRAALLAADEDGKR